MKSGLRARVQGSGFRVQGFAIAKGKTHIRMWGLILFCFLLRPALAAGCLYDGRYLMGTILQVTLCHADTSQNQPAADELFASATRLDQFLTTFSTESTISHLNAHA
ncbi:MAG: hypothetical protein ACRD2L_01305, partial [Terriglobia bacterium]